MGEPKPKNVDNLRTPKPKKSLGLTVPPALRLPHDDLINQVSMPSQSSQTSLTTLTRQPEDSQINSSVAPTRDFTKVANSIHREAIPEGLFTGKSKQLYDCLYALTRGAIVPTRSVRMSRPKLMKKAAIGSRQTFDTNVERLIKVGLLEVTSITGEHKGNEYTIFIPGEKAPTTMPSQSSQTSLTTLTDPAQKLVRLVSPETSQTRHTLIVDNKDTSAISNTSSKTTTNTDDESARAFTAITEKIKNAHRRITGKAPAAHETEKWGEVIDILMLELGRASIQTKVISSVPAFLAEHLRRCFAQLERKSEPKGNSPEKSGGQVPQSIEEGQASRGAKKMTAEERAEAVQMVVDLVRSGNYTPEQAETQFAASFGAEHWAEIKKLIEQPVNGSETDLK